MLAFVFVALTGRMFVGGDTVVLLIAINELALDVLSDMSGGGFDRLVNRLASSFALPGDAGSAPKRATTQRRPGVEGQEKED